MCASGCFGKSPHSSPSSALSPCSPPPQLRPLLPSKRHVKQVGRMFTEAHGQVAVVVRAFPRTRGQDGWGQAAAPFKSADLAGVGESEMAGSVENKRFPGRSLHGAWKRWKDYRKFITLICSDSLTKVPALRKRTSNSIKLCIHFLLSSCPVVPGDLFSGLRVCGRERKAVQRPGRKCRFTDCCLKIWSA